MDDREMLEMAAKAAGICLHPAVEKSYGNWGCDRTCTTCKKDPGDASWNPRNDNGDALRLGVRLGLHIIRTHTAYGDYWSVSVGYPVSELRMDYVHEPIYADANAATRRAILRAAAEIGRAMP